MRVAWMLLMVAVVVVVVPSLASADCPSLDAIQRRAEAFAGLDGAPRWRARSRWSAVVPVISARLTSDTGWEEGSAASRAAVGPIDRQQGIDVRLTWRLERLVFDPGEPRLYDAERRARRDRVALRQDVATAYFRWRKAIAASEPDDLAAAEALAQLDAFTGGWLGRSGCR